MECSKEINLDTENLKKKKKRGKNIVPMDSSVVTHVTCAYQVVANTVSLYIGFNK